MPLNPGAVRIRGKVIESNAAGVTLEFDVIGRQTFKVAIPSGTLEGGDVGAEVTVEGELLSIVDTASSQGKGLGFGSEVAHVKVHGAEFYCDPAILEEVGGFPE